MARAHGKSGKRENVAVTMAGWLFADLLLVLFLVGLGMQSTAQPTPKLPSPPAVPPPPALPTLAKEPITISLDVDYRNLLAGGEARRRAAEELRTNVAAAVLDKGALGGERAGMVLVWGHNSVVADGMRISAAVAEELPGADRAFFGDSTLRPFWGGNREPPSRIRLEIYVLK